jgi:hypothetical protein
VLIILAVIIYLPVCLEFKYIDGDLKYRVTYAFITFYPKKSKKKKSKKKSTKSANAKDTSKTDKPKKSKAVTEDSKSESESKEDTKSSEKSEIKEKDKQKEKSKAKDGKKSKDADMDFIQTIDMVLDIFKAIKVNLGKFIKSFKVTDLYVDFTVANEDAYECALNFGKLNIAVYNILAYLDNNIKVKKKSINIVPKYNSSDSKYDISFKVKLGFGNGVGKILVMVFKVIPILKKNDII